MKLSSLCIDPLPDIPDLTEEVYIGIGAEFFLPGEMHRRLGEKAMCIADPDTWNAYSSSDPRLLSRERVSLHLLPRHPQADSQTVRQLVEKAEGSTGLLAIGSGTINDLVKMAAYLLDIPYIVIATAASMNGYASGIAAILENGLKTTQIARPPRVIFLNTHILKIAPFKLTQAGLGDLISKPVSNADYWLCDQMENSGYSELPGKIVDRAMREALENLAGLTDKNDSEDSYASFRLLSRALTLSGISMFVAGSSSPASGGEHLISHLWDMEAHTAQKETNLHGTQVGIATCITSALYHQLLRIEQPNFKNPEPWETEEKRIRQEFGPLSDTVLAQAKKKHEKAAMRVELLKKKWGKIREKLLAMNILSPQTLRSYLLSISAPATIEELGYDREYAHRTIRLAKDIRDRYTVLDLAFETGFFPDAIESVLDESGVSPL